MLREWHLRSKGHISKKEDIYAGQIVQQVKIAKWKRSRPKRRWKDCIKNDMEAMGLMREDAQDQALRRAKIHTCDSI